MKQLSNFNRSLNAQFKNNVKDSSVNKPGLLTLVTLFMIPFLLGSCEAVGGIFKAGMNFGIFIVIAIIIAIVVLMMRSGKNKTSR